MFAQDYLLHSTVYITTDGHPSRLALLDLTSIAAAHIRKPR